MHRADHLQVLLDNVLSRAIAILEVPLHFATESKIWLLHGEEGGGGRVIAAGAKSIDRAYDPAFPSRGLAGGTSVER